ncbi:MAG: hypothetical protein ACLU5B_00665 [Mediterraneibacter faecis]
MFLILAGYIAKGDRRQIALMPGIVLVTLAKAGTPFFLPEQWVY